jgi:hypothetical protein
MLKKLVAHFDAYGDFPIDAYDIAAQIKATQVVQHINFYEDPEMDPEVLIGVLDRYCAGTPPNEAEYADVYYAPALGPAKTNVVQTKELMNILDDSSENAQTRAEVNLLIEEMVAPPELMSAQTRSDHQAIAWAMFVLFPPSLRRQLITPYHQNRVSASEIAKFTNLPIEYVRWVMADGYARFYQVLMGQPLK